MTKASPKTSDKTASETTLNQFLLSAGNRESTAVQFKKDKRWQTLQWSEYLDHIDSIASALIENGVKAGDKVAIFSATRFEWAVCDLATISLQAITIPIYHTMTGEELEFILNNSEAKVLFVEDKNLLKLFQTVAPRCNWVEKIFVFDPKAAGAEKSFWQLYEDGQSTLGDNRPKIQKAREKSTAKDPISIVYTSGTTGQPKGVVLTHEQAISECTEAFQYVGVLTSDVSLSFLPYSHVLGRIELWGHLCNGFTMAFAESIERIPQNLKEIHPTILVAVPRIFEKVYLKIQAQIESNRMQKKMFAWALRVGRKVGELRIKHEPVPLHLIPEYELANRFLLNRIREAFGGKLRFAISGGAPMNADIALFFHACGILILEGYGLTETTAAITVNAPFNYKFGSVGKPIGDVKLKIAEDGEVLVKSRKVMKEYYNDPESTEKVLKDGWFHTGDIGEISESGDLKITDRKKDLIKTAGGKYVAPQRLEGFLKTSPLISHVHIHGDQRKFVVALITLDKGYVSALAKDRGWSFPSFQSLAHNPQIVEMVRKVVAEANSNLASYETIKRFLILGDDFSIETGELTPSLKIKRKAVDQKFKKELDSLYS